MANELKITIIKIYEKNNALRIETETEFGKDNIGLSLDSKYLDPVTNEPRWKQEVRELLEKKYLQTKATEVEIDKKLWGKEL